MFFSLYPHARRLQRLLERLLLVAVVGTLLAAVLFAVLFLLRETYAHGTALWLLGAGLILLRAAQTYRTHRRLQHAALEAHLLSQPFAPDTLAACVHRSDHLWAKSAILQALRTAEAQPSPGRLRPEEHLRRLHALFSARLRLLRPALLRPNLLVLAALFALWTLDAEPGSIPLRYGIGLTAVLLAVELLETRLSWQAQDALDRLTLGLSGWALDHARPSREQQSYQHQRLYLDQPWAAAERA